MRALEWLQSDRFENRRLAAVLVLKELAENAPTLFYVHIPMFFIHIWAALRDPDVEIRVSATSALKAGLSLIMDRESRLRIRWYYGIYETAQAVLRGDSGSGGSGGSRKPRNTRSSRHHAVGYKAPTAFTDLCWLSVNFLSLRVILSFHAFQRYVIQLSTTRTIRTCLSSVQ